MPEGDTIHRAAARLRATFAHDPLLRFEGPNLPPPHPSPGSAIAVSARGKHLLIAFDGGRTLHTHLGMHGSWRVERGPGRPLRGGGRPGAGPQVRISTARASAVVAATKTVELLTAHEVRRHPLLSALGPDLCDPSPDLDEALRRARTILDPSTPVGVALLDQRPACGIGNVYRAEVLWAVSVAPRTPLAALDGATIRTLYATAHRLLRANLGPGPRRTAPAGYATYGRAGRRCPRCGETIRAERLGEHARTVWWCPGCQTDR